MHIVSEELLLNFIKFRKGDKEAFSFFYRFFINDMYTYGRSLGTEHEDVMDAIQDVFLKAFFNKSRFDSIEHFKYSLLKSLRNRLYDLFKSKSFSKTTGLEEGVFDFSIKATVLDEMIEKEDQTIVQQKVEKLLSTLSSQQKEAVYLRYIQELDYEQIAEIMKKKVTAVRKLVSQALLKIRKENPEILLLAFILSLYNSF